MKSLVIAFCLVAVNASIDEKEPRDRRGIIHVPDYHHTITAPVAPLETTYVAPATTSTIEASHDAVASSQHSIVANKETVVAAHGALPSQALYGLALSPYAFGGYYPHGYTYDYYGGLLASAYHPHAPYYHAGYSCPYC